MSRNVISSVENSAVKLIRGCRLLMLLMNCSRLSFVSVHTNIYVSFPMCGGGGCFSGDSGFQCTHESVIVGRCHLCTHGCALFLYMYVEFIVKSVHVFVGNEF